MEFFSAVLSDPWKVAAFLIPPTVTFVLGFQAQKRLTRYRERISRLNHDLLRTRDLCKKACQDAAKLAPCLYKDSEPSEELQEIIEYPTFRDKMLLLQLNQFLKQVQEQRNIFTWGWGSAQIIVDYSAGGTAYYEFPRCGNDAIPLPNLTDDQREKLLHAQADHLRVTFKDIEKRIDKLLK